MSEEEPEQVWQKVLGATPELVSEILVREKTLTKERIEAYDLYAQQIYSKGGQRQKHESKFLKDYMQNVMHLHAAIRDSKTGSDEEEETSNEDTEEESEDDSEQEAPDRFEYHPNSSEGSTPTPQADKIDERQVSKKKSRNKPSVATEPIRQSIQRIRIHELVMTPRTFDGVIPPAWRWIDDYERASQSNTWIEDSMVRYFPTFLPKSALDWWMTMGQRELGLNPPWDELRDAFILHFIGESERMDTKKRINRTFQRDRESAANFIPRLLRLVDMVDKNKSEDELVELVKERLRAPYQEKLAMHDINSTHFA